MQGWHGAFRLIEKGNFERLGSFLAEEINPDVTLRTACMELAIRTNDFIDEAKQRAAMLYAYTKQQLRRYP